MLYDIQRMKSEINIKEVVDALFSPSEKGYCGRNYCVICPGHNDKHLGGAYIIPKNNVVYCNTCGHAYNPIDLVVAKLGISFKEALTWLDNFGGGDFELSEVEAEDREIKRKLLSNDLIKFLNIDNSAVIGIVSADTWEEYHQNKKDYIIEIESGKDGDVLSNRIYLKKEMLESNPLLDLMMTDVEAAYCIISNCAKNKKARINDAIKEEIMSKDTPDLKRAVLKNYSDDLKKCDEIIRQYSGEVSQIA